MIELGCNALLIQERLVILSDGAKTIIRNLTVYLEQKSNFIFTEEHRDDTVIILAGYTNEMKYFINTANTGLPSRFKNWIEFYISTAI